MTPRVSILLPARDAAATIEAALASIRQQTETSWECIVVNDGSQDATLEHLSAAARHDARFTIISTPRQGLIAALNDGLRHCRAPLIARMDADDVMRRQRLAVQCEALARDATLAAVGSHVRIFPRTMLADRLREYEGWLNAMQTPADVARDLLVECPVAHPTLMMRREMAALGYEDRGWPEDYDLVLRAHAHGWRIGVVPQRLLAWRDRPDSLSRTDVRYSVDRFTECKAYYLAQGFLAGADSYVLWGYGSTGRLLRKALALHGLRPSHIVEVKSSRIGQRIHGAPVIPIDALAALGRRRIVVSVARAGPRNEIRGAMESIGYVDGRDYVCAA